MDTILLATMILLAPLAGMWAFVLSKGRGAGPSPEDFPDLRIDDLMRKAARGGIQTPEEEAVSALNRIWNILLRPEERGRLGTAEDYR